MVDSRYTLSPRLWKYLKDYAEKHRKAGNGFGYGLVGPNDIARTLSARYYKDGSEVLVNRGPRKRPRRLTPRECARLMGFPDDFVIPVSDTQSYKQFGNSIVVPMVGEVARLMKPIILSAKDSEHRLRVASNSLMNKSPRYQHDSSFPLSLHCRCLPVRNYDKDS